VKSRRGQSKFKLNTAEVLEIRSGGMTVKEASKKFGLSMRHVQAVRAGEVWKNIGGLS